MLQFSGCFDTIIIQFKLKQISLPGTREIQKEGTTIGRSSHCDQQYSQSARWYALTIIGGNVYRGSAIPAYEGKYIFGTYGQTGTAPDGELFISTPSGQNIWDVDEINLVSHPDDLGYYLKGFGQDNKGEIYLTLSSNAGPSGTTGKVFKLVKAP